MRFLFFEQGRRKLATADRRREERRPTPAVLAALGCLGHILKSGNGVDSAPDRK